MVFRFILGVGNWQYQSAKKAGGLFIRKRKPKVEEESAFETANILNGKYIRFGHNSLVLAEWEKCGEHSFSMPNMVNAEIKTKPERIYCCCDAVSFAIQINLIHFCSTIDTLSVPKCNSNGNIRNIFYAILWMEFTLFAHWKVYVAKRCRLQL